MSLVIKSNSQNLIIDSGFEDYRYCPKSVSDFTLKHWSVPTKGTSDYFNVCSRKMHPTNGYNGSQKTRSGLGYIGLISGKKFLQKPTAEYVQSKLKDKLSKDSTYYLEFYVNLRDMSMQAAKDIGALLLKSKLNSSTTHILKSTPTIRTKDFICDTTKWEKISGTFIAEGNEQFIIIGTFGNKKSFIKTNRKEFPRSNSAYYYIDDVCLKKVSKESDCHCEETSNTKKNTVKSAVTFNKESKIILPDFTFKTNQWELEVKEVPLLDSLADYLQENENYKLTISGHTDTIGKEVDNIELSGKRAETIKNYLVEKGIAENRIQTKALGSAKPIITNKTEEGRAKNRRVEIKIKENY